MQYSFKRLECLNVKVWVRCAFSHKFGPGTVKIIHFRGFHGLAATRILVSMKKYIQLINSRNLNPQSQVPTKMFSRKTQNFMPTKIKVFTVLHLNDHSNKQSLTKFLFHVSETDNCEIIFFLSAFSWFSEKFHFCGHLRFWVSVYISRIQ